MALIAVSGGPLVRIALLEADHLREYWLWNREQPDGVGDEFTGRIEAVAPALAGRFVTLGAATGFLPDSAGGKALTEGQLVSVRVTRAPQGGKGPRLAATATPPGDRPGLHRRGPGPLLELAARFPASDIRIDDYALLAELRPALGDRARHALVTFDAVLEDEIATLADPIVPLPLGARLNITPAPAATLLDIDAAAASHIRPLELNLAIIPEICRQIILRNLSGGLLIDFAGLKPSARAALGGPLKLALAADHLNPEFLGFSHLGLAELTRRRIRPPLHEILAP
jgi:Ribonuclease G/E